MKRGIHICGIWIHEPGPHEGQVGAAVYYYDIATSSVEEKVFISTDKSWASTILELGRLVYYNVEEDLLYILVDETLYEIDVERDERNALAEGLTEDQYVVSDDGHMIAYQEEGQIVVKGTCPPGRNGRWRRQKERPSVRWDLS